MIDECRLDAKGFREQRERYRALAGQVASLERRPEELEVYFEIGVDADLLERTLATERDCCPFFRLGYDRQARRLIARVEREDQAPALDALAAALTAGATTGASARASR